MTVTPSQVTVDFLLKERARELTGEHWRWYDLKRMGKLTKQYFQSTNQVVSVDFTDGKHVVRPIPQSFLDAIDNEGEYRTNGY